jgi:hypothetical protein
MKKVNSIPLLLLIVGSLSFSQVLAHPQDIEGWNKARWNMPEDEVKKGTRVATVKTWMDDLKIVLTATELYELSMN